MFRIMIRYLIVLALLVLPVEAYAQDAGWSLGLGFTANALGPSSDSYELFEGVVEVSEHGDSTIRPIMETHLVWPLSNALSIGPFVGAALEADNLIAAIGSGIVFELSAGEKALTMGAGLWAERGSTLGRGLQVGKTAPSIRTEERTMYSLLIFVGGNPF